MNDQEAVGEHPFGVPLNEDDADNLTWEEIDRLTADLAAARVALEDAREWLAKEVRGVENGGGPTTDELRAVRQRIDEVLSRLGTGEALAAVRHAQRSLEAAFGSTHPAAIAVRAVFGG